MDKVKKILIPSLIFSALIFPLISFAETPAMSASNIASTSVDIKATGLIVDQTYVILIVNFVNHALIKEFHFKADSSGSGSESFIQLDSGKTYIAKLYKTDPKTGDITENSGASDINFTTLGGGGEGISLSTTNITSSSATINATGMIPGEKYSILILSLSKNEKFPEVGFTSDSSGGASHLFTGLSVNSPYVVHLFKEPEGTTLSSLNFKTLSSGGSDDGGGTGGGTTGRGTTGGGNSDGGTPGGGLVPCESGCGWNDFIKLVHNVIDFILYKMVIPIAAISFAYAGYSLITAGGGEGKAKAKNVFTDTVIGLIIAIAAWLIIKLLLSIAHFDASFIIK